MIKEKTLSETPAVVISKPYKHIQVGFEPLLILIILGVVTLNTAEPIWWLGLIILLGIAVVVGCLVIKVDDHCVSWFFGPGLFRRSILLGDVKSVQVTKKPFLSGYGIRETRLGKLYIVSGRTVIDLELSDGKHIMLGCSKAQELQQVIQHKQVTSS